MFQDMYFFVFVPECACEFWISIISMNVVVAIMCTPLNLQLLLKGTRFRKRLLQERHQQYQQPLPTQPHYLAQFQASLE